MVSLYINLNNFSYWEILDTIFGQYSTDFVYTATGIFRRTKPPVCQECGMQMNYNGYNTYGKRGLGSVKIGRYVCPYCNKKREEECSFWEKLKGDFFDIVSMIDTLLRLHHVSYPAITDIMALIYPRGQDTIFNAFADSVEELYDSKDPATIMAFLVKYLDPNKRTFVVYFVKGAPATNNGVENDYSTSLKTHRKKQLRSDRGIENQMKLSAMKRAGLLGRCKKTLLDAFLMFVPFLRVMSTFG